MKKKFKPEISIIMSVYNEQDNLFNCLQSVLCQSFRNFEFLIFDDNSTDRTWHILGNFKNRDSRIKLFKNPKITNFTNILNYLIENSKAPLIARIDGDDEWNKEKLRLQFNQIKNSSYRIISTNNILLDGNRQTRTKFNFSTYEIYKNLFMYNFFSHSSVLFKKKDGKIYDKKFYKCQDYEAWTKFVIKKNQPAKILKQHLTTINLEKKLRFLTIINTLKIQLGLIRYYPKNRYSYIFYIIIRTAINFIKYLVNKK